MNTKIIGVILAALLLGGGVFFVLTGSDDESASSSSPTSENSSVAQSETTNTNKLGIDTAALSGAYQLDIDTNEDGQTLTGTFLLDGQGNFSTEVNQDGQTVGLVFLDGKTYVQNPATQEWIVYPAGSAAAPTFDVGDFAFTDDDINDINEDTDVVELDQQPCSLGMCRVYQDNDATSGEIALVKVDVATGRLAEIMLTDSATQEVSTITYSYPSDITIVAPEGAVEFDLDSLTQ